MIRRKKQSWLLYGLIYISILTFSTAKLQAQWSSMELWLKADDGITADANNFLLTWADRSGKGRNFKGREPLISGRNDNVTVYNTTTNLMNFQPSANFSEPITGPLSKGGVNKLLSDEVSASQHIVGNSTKSYYVFYVSRIVNTSTDFQTVFAFTGGSGALGQGDDVGWQSSKPAVRFNAGGMGSGTTLNYAGLAPTNTRGINTIQIPNAVAPCYIHINGAYHYVTTDNGRTLNKFSSGTGKSVIASAGGGAGGNSQFDGDLQELIILSGTAGNYLTYTNGNNDFTKINSYLSVKYGISLNEGLNYYAMNGTVVWTYTAGYSGNVFGIGRDNTSGLYQKQSHNIDDTTDFTVYVGNYASSNLPALNSQNTLGSLSNNQYVLIGSGPNTAISLSSNRVYENTSIDANATIGSQSRIYRAQVTDGTNNTTATINVRFRPPVSDYTHVMVSKSNTFPAGPSGGTRIYGVDNEIPLGNGYVYIKFIKLTNWGPARVGDGLRLWLRADALVSTDPMTSGSSYLAAYPDAPSGTTVQAVKKWTNYSIGTPVYEWNTSSLIPVWKDHNLQMNYHPAVRFWGSGAYLTTANSVMSLPENGGHTAFFVANSTNNNGFFALGFAATHLASSTTPAYGANNVSTTTGTFRVGGSNTTSSINTFTANATNLLGYRTSSGTSSAVNFRFNGNENSAGSVSSSSLNFMNPSTLGAAQGSGYTLPGVMGEVIVYNKDVSAADREKVENYLALKYGITPYYAPGTSQRFHYKFSNGTTSIWDCNATFPVNFNTYSNRVAALVRDDTHQINNRQTHSTGEYSILHLGVPGSTDGGKLLMFDGSNNSLLGELSNNQAVIFGDNNASGTVFNDCGDTYTCRFARTWLIHKTMSGSINLLVGAQNNAGIFGSSTYYPILGDPANEVCMIVYEPDATNIKLVIPMKYDPVGEEFQCNYTFTDENTYITFAYKGECVGGDPSSPIPTPPVTNPNPTPTDCGDPLGAFSGYKAVDWSGWVKGSKTGFSSSSPITASTTVTYHNADQQVLNYPRATHLSLFGAHALNVRRKGSNDEIIIKIEFNYPVIPDFAISDIDATGKTFEEIEIIGTCGGATVYPRLSYATTGNRITYDIIQPNIARAHDRVLIDNTLRNSKNGMVNVAFETGVKEIYIKYRLIGTQTLNTARWIDISPIRYRAALVPAPPLPPGEPPLPPLPPPPPPVSPEGWSFTKQAHGDVISACEPLTYTFKIQNFACDPKTLTSFVDNLPANMEWEEGSFGLDPVSAGLNPGFDPSPVGGNLQINDLMVPGNGAYLTMSATAVFVDPTVSTTSYSNRATINYTGGSLQSIDGISGANNTTVSVTPGSKLTPLTVNMSYDHATFKEGDLLEFTFTITNPNASINTILSFGFPEGITYVPVLSGIPSGAKAYDSLEELLIASLADEDIGFPLPTGSTVIKFVLEVPASISDWDKLGSKIGDLAIDYSLTFSSSDPCVQGLTKRDGINIPYRGKAYIITNRHITAKIVE